jgi:hypothetical protein
VRGGKLELALDAPGLVGRARDAGLRVARVGGSSGSDLDLDSEAEAGGADGVVWGRWDPKFGMGWDG